MVILSHKNDKWLEEKQHQIAEVQGLGVFFSYLSLGSSLVQSVKMYQYLKTTKSQTNWTIEAAVDQQLPCSG